jgi:hypothetical protein
MLFSREGKFQHLASYSWVNDAQGWASNFKNVAPQKQNPIRKPREQYAKRNCAFDYLKHIAPQQLMLRIQIPTKNVYRAKNASATFLNKKSHNNL